MKKTIQILGSTGSIGCNALDVIMQHQDKFQVKTITAHKNVKKLAEQAISCFAEHVVIVESNKYTELKSELSGTKVKIYSGHNELLDIASKNYDVTIIGITGIAALPSIEKAIINSKVIGLANKESIVCAGDIILKLAEKHKTKIIPMDSEHNAIFQVLEKDNIENVNNITITGSGGPFLNTPFDKLSNITPEEAIRHPKWKMGKKLSVDCSNMMNKGLEVIEACKLFNLPQEKVFVLVHPQSIVHGMVNYNDGSNISQLSMPDMRTPISLALNYPRRLKFNFKPLNLAEIGNLNFFPPDYKRFPLLKTALMALQQGDDALIQLNAANELAVEAFLRREIGYLDIPKIIDYALNNISKNVELTTVQDVLDYSDYIINFIKKELKI